jgi:hypothetical protein
MVYAALLSMMRTPQLPVVDCTDAPAYLNGLVRFAERRNLVSARVPSHLKRSLPAPEAGDLVEEILLLLFTTFRHSLSVKCQTVKE